MTQLSAPSPHGPDYSGTYVSVVTYSGSLNTARPSGAAAVYWVDFPSTPTNAQAQDIIATTAGSTADGPYHVNVVATVKPKASSVAETLSYQAGCWYNANVNAGLLVNNYIEWDVYVGSGTYSLRTIWIRGTNAGIVTVSVDGTDIGTIDMYGTFLVNNVSDLTTSSLAVGHHTIRFRVASKNASSTAYGLGIQAFSLTRTGA